MSGVARGQVKAAKYVVFRNVATSFFSRYVCDFHEKHQQSTFWVRIMCSYANSIAYPDVVLQGQFHRLLVASYEVLWSSLFKLCWAYPIFYSLLLYCFVSFNSIGSTSQLPEAAF